jgi:predicted nuclease of predicted toxin-antitoxin system
VRLLLDANLSPRLAVSLTTAGYDVTHVVDLDLLAAPDSVIFDRAVDDGYVVITADTDFSMLLALRRASSPSVILLRRVSELSPDEHGRLLLANLPAILDDLTRGVVVSLSPTRLAIRQLPIGP